MQLFVPCVLLLSFAIRCLFGTRLQVEKLSVNSNRSALECLETVISVSHWAVHDFLMIADDMNAVDDKFFQRFPNIRWELHSIRNNNLTGFSNVIFFTSNFESFKATVSVINFQRIDSRAKLVIIVAKNFGSLEEIKTASKGIPEAMWKLDKTRVVYLVPCKKDFFAMTYFPFARNCHAGELELLDIWKRKEFVKGAELFPEKMLNIRGCVQNHSVVFRKIFSMHLREELTETGQIILGGIGGRLITIIAEKMNMKLHAVTYPYHLWLSLQAQVGRGESLFSVSGTIPIAGHLEFLDIGSGYMEDSFGLGYNASSLEVPWQNLASPLSKKIWQWIGYTSLVFCGILFVANRCHRGEITSDKLRILDGFGIFFGMGRVLPKSHFGRYFFGIWIVYSYLINVTYSSMLVSFLTTPRDISPMNTLEDLLAEGIDFGGAPFHREFYHDPSDPVMMKIYDNFKIWYANESANVLLNRKGVIGIFNSYVYMHNSDQTGNVNYQLRMLEEKAFTYQVPISMRRGSPFTLGVRRYTSQLIQGGFHKYWLKYYTQRPISTGIHGKTPTVISVHHVRGILYLHIAGLTFSCIVFLGELIFHKYFR